MQMANNAFALNNNALFCINDTTNFVQHVSIPEVTSHLFLKYYLNICKKMKLASKEKNGNVKPMFYKCSAIYLSFVTL